MKARTATCGVVNIDGLSCTLQANWEAHTFGHYDEVGSTWPLTPDDISAWAAPHWPSAAASSEAFARVAFKLAVVMAAGASLTVSYLAFGWWGLLGWAAGVCLVASLRWYERRLAHRIDAAR